MQFYVNNCYSLFDGVADSMIGCVVDFLNLGDAYASFENLYTIENNSIGFESIGDAQIYKVSNLNESWWTDYMGLNDYYWKDLSVEGRRR